MSSDASTLVAGVDGQPSSDFLAPDCCVECNAALVAEHFTEDEEYENANIYIRRITGGQNKQDVNTVLEEVCPLF